MTQPAGPAAMFVVGLDRAEVLRRRRIVRRTQWVGVWVIVIGVALIAGISVAMIISFGMGTGVFFLLTLAAMIPLMVSATQAWRRLASAKQWYAATELPPFAMRMTAQALELGCEGAPQPIVLPWHTVLGFRLRRRYGQPVLELALAPGVTAGTPGVLGADQPAAAAMLWPGKMVKQPGFYGVAALDQPVEAIDQGLRSFSGGSAAVSR